jgi:hypothetical protein
LFTILAGSTGPVSYQHVGENSGDNEKNRRRNSENEHGQTEDGVRGGSGWRKNIRWVSNEGRQYYRGETAPLLTREHLSPERNSALLGDDVFALYIENFFAHKLGMDSAPVANVPRSIYTPCVVGYFSTKVEMTHRYCGLLKLVVENKPIGHKPPLVLFLRGFPFESP